MKDFLSRLMTKLLFPKHEATRRALNDIQKGVELAAENAKRDLAAYKSCDAERRKYFHDYCEEKKKLDELTARHATLQASAELLSESARILREELGAAKRSNASLRGTITRLKRGSK